MSCIALFIGKEILPWSDVDAIIHLAKECRARVKAYYVQRANLQHYGEVDHLVTAGAADDFIQYVKAQDAETAEKAFQPIKALLTQHEIGMSIEVLYEGTEGGSRKCLEKLRVKEPELFIFPVGFGA